MDSYARRTNHDVVINDLDECISTTTNDFNDFAERSFTEGLADATRADGAHGVVGSVLRVTLNATIENDVNDGGDRKNVSNRRERRAPF